MASVSDGSSIQAFRQEVRRFVDQALPATVRNKVRLGLEITKEESLAWQQCLARKGWLVPNWPEEWQGPGWSAEKRSAFHDEMVLANAPEFGGITFGMIGPILIKFGTPAQKRFFLPRILELKDWWCQGYSEPNAGSDLASLSTRAVRHRREDGSEVYRVNGSKIWTSGAQHANWIFCLVRTDTDGRPQEGITFLLINMDTPGVSVRPIKGIHGWSLFNQVYFDDVDVPVENRVGEENGGWTIAKSLLEHERLNLSRVAENRRRLHKVRLIAEQVHEAGQPIITRPWFIRRHAELQVRLEALAAMVLRFQRQSFGGQKLGPETGMLKLVGSQLIQEIENLAVDVVGPDSLPFDQASLFEVGPLDAGRSEYAPTASSRRFVTRGYTIAGGSSEIQHDLLAKQVLGL
ncbi:MAG: acyl-CoA dehydrogenase family protein [Burkholderiaceae bacterium]